jgi:hypothetical protein
MLAEKYKEALPVLSNVKRQPCVSLIIPFNPKMISKAEIIQSLKAAINKIKRELFNNYERDITNVILIKLADTIAHLDYTTHKKSIAIYISSEVEKVFYLDITVTEKIIVDTSFEIRDIVLNRKDEHEFLLLVITGSEEKIYAGNRNKLQLIVSNNIERVQRDLPEPVGNFTEVATIKEIKFKKFLFYIDRGLQQILKYYPLPLFVMAPEKTISYFQKITKHNNSIIDFVHGNFEHATESELIKAIEAQLHNWDAIREKHLINHLKSAEDNLNITTGIHDVWMQANRRYKQLLIVERDFYCPAFVTAKGETIFCNSKNDNIDNNNKMIAKDAVDDIIEKVLGNGGNVEFVNDLKDYNRIALTEY